jgi:hypothetical protein
LAHVQPQVLLLCYLLRGAVSAGPDHGALLLLLLLVVVMVRVL